LVTTHGKGEGGAAAHIKMSRGKDAAAVVVGMEGHIKMDFEGRGAVHAATDVERRGGHCGGCGGVG
jgi:hypothetical protein